MKALELTDRTDNKAIVNFDNVVMIQKDHEQRFDDETKKGSKIFFTSVAGQNIDYLLVKDSVDEITEALEDITVVMQKSDSVFR